MSQTSFRTRFAANAASALRHPATRWMGLIYIFSAVVFVVASGDAATFLLQLGLAAWTLLAALLAVSMTTQPAIAWEASPAPARSRLAWQLSVIGLVILYTLLRNSAQLNDLPVLGSLHQAQAALPYNLSNPLLYVVLPLIFLLLLGARPAELGLSLPRSRSDWSRTGWLVLIMAFLNIAYLIPALLFGNFTLQTLGNRLLNNLLQNGFSEEFLMRGALMTCLIRLSGTGWGIVLSSLIFGLWHISANLPMLDGSLPTAMAFSIISQGIAGIGFAVAMQRGGNLAAPSANHVLSHFFPF